MATQTTNFGLSLPEATDVFNPLIPANTNAELIDDQMKKNQDNSVTTATELVTGTVHALTRMDTDTAMFRFTATSNFEAGHTFTVDGVQVTALLTNGTTLPTGAYIIGSEVLCVLKGTLLTVLSCGNTLAQDSEKLNGQSADYYATASALETVSDLATANGTKITELNQSLTDKGNAELLLTTQTYETAFTLDFSDYQDVYIEMVVGTIVYVNQRIPASLIKSLTSSSVMGRLEWSVISQSAYFSTSLFFTSNSIMFHFNHMSSHYTKETFTYKVYGIK